MSSSFYEILELSSGEIVLRRSGDEQSREPLVTLTFSAESKAFLGRGRFEVAKAMIEAGMEAASELAAEAQDELTFDTTEIGHHLLH